MEVIDRTLAPAFKNVDDIGLSDVKKQTLSNGWPLLTLRAGIEEVVRIQWAFHLSGNNRSGFMADRAANAMMRDGTGNRDSRQIALELDGSGSHLGLSVEGNLAHVTLYTLSSQITAILPLVKDLITNSVYNQPAFDLYLQSQRQSLMVNRKKVSFMSRKAFKESILGKDHLNGFVIDDHDLEVLSPEGIREAAREVYMQRGAYVMMAGQWPDGVEAAIDDVVKDIPCIGMPEAIIKSEEKVIKPGRKLEVINGTVQAAIRMGMPSINRAHEDFPALFVTNTVLGGYFGSRLMSNIREDKGFTYGIGSGLVSLPGAGYFFITTEVGADVCRQAIDEIYKEVNRLKNDEVPEEELSLVRNYILGSLMRSADGPFSQADVQLGLINLGLDISYFSNLVNKVKTVQPDEILAMANKYWDTGAFVEIVAGPAGCC